MKGQVSAITVHKWLITVKMGDESGWYGDGVELGRPVALYLVWASTIRVGVVNWCSQLMDLSSRFTPH